VAKSAGDNAKRAIGVFCSVIPQNSYGFVVRWGLCLGLNTSGAAAITAEDNLMSSNSGGIETAATAVGNIGVATANINNGATGVIYVECLQMVLT
jgi:hypothetical protein